MLHYETQKLFYNKYFYKLVVRNSLANIFREKKFSFAREVLDDLQYQFEKGEVLVRSNNYRKTPVELLEFLECQTLYKELLKNIDYRIRIEVPYLQIYTNDKQWLLELSQKVLKPEEFWQPDSAYVNFLKENVIIISKPTKFPYRVTLGDIRVNPGFSLWIQRNHDKIKIGRGCKEAIDAHSYCANLYFYVRDEKVLELVKLMITPSIRRIDKLVCKQDIDK